MVDRRAFGILVVALVLLAALAGALRSPGADAGRSTGGGGGPVRVPFHVIASEKTLPADFASAAPEDVLVRLAADQDALRALWSYFGLRAELPSPAWEREVVLLLGTGESGNCPLDVKEIAFDGAAGRLRVYLEPRTGQGDACTMDFTPRTFALALPRSLTDSGWREVQVLGVPGEPVLPL